MDKDDPRFYTAVLAVLVIGGTAAIFIALLQPVDATAPGMDRGERVFCPPLSYGEGDTIMYDDDGNMTIDEIISEDNGVYNLTDAPEPVTDDDIVCVPMWEIRAPL